MGFPFLLEVGTGVGTDLRSPTVWPVLASSPVSPIFVPNGETGDEASQYDVSAYLLVQCEQPTLRMFLYTFYIVF